jgi:hypothetical protein
VRNAGAVARRALKRASLITKTRIKRVRKRSKSINTSLKRLADRSIQLSEPMIRTRARMAGRAAAPLPETLWHAMFRGHADWQVGALIKASDDVNRQIEGYASATSVNVGDKVNLHVSVRPGGKYTIAFHRFGAGFEGAQHIMSTPELRGRPRPAPLPDLTTGEVACHWPASYTLTVPDTWMSGFYIAVLTSAAGFRSCIPFVVRNDEQAADICIIVPVTTYQAYNEWPRDQRRGKSLYYGFTRTGERVWQQRAQTVSFDRPYVGLGMPIRCEDDLFYIGWAEEQGYDVTYATSIDMHAGRIDPARYKVLVFSGHDEYWSTEMRAVADRAVALGRSLMFMAANSAYWHIRVRASAGGQPDRAVVCCKSKRDPGRTAAGPTTKWRAILGGTVAEQALIGVQYNSMVGVVQPLVVTAASHWFWEGTGVIDGDTIPNIVGGEADGVFPDAPKPIGGMQTLVSATPFPDRARKTTLMQHTSVWETPAGGIVFAAATLLWTAALSGPNANPLIKIVTANVMDRALTLASRPPALPDRMPLDDRNAELPERVTRRLVAGGGGGI